MPERDFDIVLFGATGFTGGLTAEYLAHHAPAGARWALAGRNIAKLESVRARLSTIDAALANLPLVQADSDDAGSLLALAASTRVLITTVGPYIAYGDGLVAACAAAGTDYVDLTGEQEFVDRSYLRHHDKAVQTGARLIHSCGFDSIPHDLGAYFTVQHLPAGVPLRVSGYVRVSAAFSGGTLHSAVTAFSRGRQLIETGRARRSAEARPTDRSSRYVVGVPHHDSGSGGWAVPLPTIDGSVVARSGRAIDRYGPDFRYSHFASVPHLWTAVGAAAGVGSVIGLAQLPPVRRAILRRFPQGEGPSARKRADSWFSVTFVGEGGGEQVRTRVSGGDPGYDETAKMLSESALCLAFDELPATSGQVTTAAAMGDALLDRLQKGGIGFEVLQA